MLHHRLAFPVRVFRGLPVPALALLVLVSTLAAPVLAAPPPGWWSYPHASGCYGGALCRANGEGVRVLLASRPVLAVRFYSHDDVGPGHRARLRVRLDGEILARELDVPRTGRTWTLSAGGLHGRVLRLEILGGEEVVVEDLEVLYGRHPSWLLEGPLPGLMELRDTAHEGTEEAGPQG